VRRGGDILRSNGWREYDERWKHKWLKVGGGRRSKRLTADATKEGAIVWHDESGRGKCHGGGREGAGRRIGECHRCSTVNVLRLGPGEMAEWAGRGGRGAGAKSVKVRRG
jgi:hypothetical protein